MESILGSIKKQLGIGEEYTQFDSDVTININTAFSVLTQLGVGPQEGFFIKDKSSKWTDFIGEEKKLELVKTYIYLKVKLVFDPPQSSAVIEVYKENIKELEWRLNVLVDPGKEETTNE